MMNGFTRFAVGALSAALACHAAEAPFLTLIGDPADTTLTAALERYPSCFDAVIWPTEAAPFIFALPDSNLPRRMISEALRFAALSTRTVARVGDGEAFASSATAHGLCVQAFLLLAYGAESVEFDFLRNAHETPDRFAGTYFSELTFWRPFLQAYARHSRETRPGGLLPFRAQGTPALQPRTFPNTLHAADALAPLGLPVCPGSPYPVGYLLTAANVAGMSDVELQRVLSGGVLLDGSAVAALQARGAGAGIQLGAFPRSVQQVAEEFTDDELNVNRVGYVWRPQALAEQTFALVPSNDTARVIGRYRDDQGKIMEAASVLIEQPSGGRLAAFGFNGFSPYASEARRRQLLLAADWVTQNRLPVFVENAAQAVVIPRVSMAGDLRSVALVNASIDTQPPVTLRLRGCREGITYVEWLTPKEKPVPLTVRWEGQDALITLPAVGPWQVGWLRPVE
ncbi:MAG TPA: hypothetical protein P5111_02450 [Kiritimatiellia bacterium]|nr:hypothetical protein [Kiritimatiellia bacterium]